MKPVGDYSMDEPRDLSSGEDWYKEKSTREEQTVICKEYMQSVDGWGEYDDWLEGKQIGQSDEALRAYCERLDSFWEFLERTTPNEE